jgi:hypothetical protein
MTNVDVVICQKPYGSRYGLVQKWVGESRNLLCCVNTVLSQHLLFLSTYFLINHSAAAGFVFM